MISNRAMRSQDADKLGQLISALVNDGQIADAYALLAPVLAERTPFRLLDRIGAAIGVGPVEAVNTFLDHIAAHKTMGGWVVIASALGGQLSRDLPGAFTRCRKFILDADVWYATDILGERVPGPALVADYTQVLPLLSPWRYDLNRWIRRTVGVAVHFWAKRAHGEPEYISQAKALLAFLAPMFEEQDMDAIKGVGWGLKTLGRFYPDLVAEWLTEQVVHLRRNPRILMLRKALTYLSDEYRVQLS